MEDIGILYTTSFNITAKDVNPYSLNPCNLKVVKTCSSASGSHAGS